MREGAKEEIRYVQIPPWPITSVLILFQVEYYKLGFHVHICTYWGVSLMFLKHKTS